jgi:hypothetical protein
MCNKIGLEIKSNEIHNLLLWIFATLIQPYSSLYFYWNLKFLSSVFGFILQFDFIIALISHFQRWICFAQFFHCFKQLRLFIAGIFCFLQKFLHWFQLRAFHWTKIQDFKGFINFYSFFYERKETCNSVLCQLHSMPLIQEFVPFQDLDHQKLKISNKFLQIFVTSNFFFVSLDTLNRFYFEFNLFGK